MVRRVRAAPDEPVDERFPGFADVVELRAGPGGTDYGARELGTNREVRLRRVPVGDGPGAERFGEVERRLPTLAAISAHPNVVTLYRSFRAPDGAWLLVLEPASRTLADRVATGGPLSPRDAVAVAVGLSGAVETAHRAGVLHGAVSPNTILVNRYGAPLLAGFSLSAGPVAARADRPDPGAPELRAGGVVSPATDVHGLAATLRRLLPDPDRWPAPLAELLRRALATVPAQRPATAAAFAAELGAVEAAQGWPATPFVVGSVPVPPRRPMPGPGAFRPRPRALSDGGVDPSSGPSSAPRSPGSGHPPSTTWD